MPNLNNPIVLEITKEDGRRMTIDVIPVYEEEHHGFVATNELRLYEGYPPDDWNTPADEAQRERYLDHLDYTGDQNPCFLGLLKYTEDGIDTWLYAGSLLNSAELHQIIAVIESYTAEMEFMEMEIQAILDEPGTDESHSFIYHEGSRSDIIRIDRHLDSFLVLINEEVTAEIEFRDTNWTVVAGQIADPDLLLEIISHIRQTKLN